MYKSKLQELCQRRAWSLPDYETTREGPPHNPSFSSTVTVNDIPFRSSSPARSAKLAQNAAAMVAFQHFSQPSPKPKPKPNPNPVPIPIPNPTLSIPNLSSLPQPSLCPPSTSSPSSPGSSTDVDNILPTNRVLQPNLEEACQTSQISSPGTIVKDIMTTQDQKNMSHLFKNQLQSYAQKRNLNLPVYSSEWEGPPHSMRFKCKVTFDGQTYESPNFYSTLKDAEHAAAEVALRSLSPGGVQEDHTVLYKNLLQEFVQKEGLRLPIYSTTKSGEAHKPLFVSQVEVEGEHFMGQEAKSKKQAEMSAAKVAYTTLSERKDQSSLFPLSTHQGQAPEFSPDSSEANVITGWQHHANPQSSVSSGFVIENQPNKDKGKSDQSSLFSLSAHQGPAPEFSSDHSELNVISGLQHNANPNSLVSPGLFNWNQPDEDKLKKGLSSSGNTNGCSEDSSISSDKSVPSLSDSINVASETSKMSSTVVSTQSHRTKVVVYSRKTNVKIEDGGTLTCSDDKWVAYSYSY